jgi:hypothetical protein
LLGRLVEDVVDHLHRVDDAGFDKLERRIGLMVVDRDSDGADFAAALQILERAAPLVAGNPFRVPDMQLLQIDGLHLQVAQALFGASNDVVVGKDLPDRDARARGPELVLRRRLGRDENLAGRFAHHPAHQFLAVAVAIGQRRVDEVQAQFDSPPQRGHGLVVVASQPLFAADAPGAVADFTNLKSCPSEFAISHSPPDS